MILLVTQMDVQIEKKSTDAGYRGVIQLIYVANLTKEYLAAVDA